MSKTIKIIVAVVLTIGLFAGLWALIGNMIDNAAWERVNRRVDFCLAIPDQTEAQRSRCLDLYDAHNAGYGQRMFEAALYAAGATLVICLLVVGILVLLRNRREERALLEEAGGSG